jgi:proline racemase
MSFFPQIKIIDTHLGGEPTRVVLDGGPELGLGPLSERVKVFREKFDNFRTAIAGEPRGSDALTGALIVEPHDKTCQFGVIFFNRAGYPALSGHGLIGTIAALAHGGLVEPGLVRLDTPAGYIAAVLGIDRSVTFDNVPSYRKEKALALYLPGVGDVPVDLAWGGSWFCLIERHDQRLEAGNIAQLTDYCTRIRQAVNSTGYPEVDHVALFGATSSPGANSRNFVLSPGQTYDRSASGTATSAWLACLAADGRLAAGAEWVQESIIGSTIKTSYRWQGTKVVPTITSWAHVMGEGNLLLDPADPLLWGIR